MPHLRPEDGSGCLRAQLRPIASCASSARNPPFLCICSPDTRVSPVLFLPWTSDTPPKRTQKLLAGTHRESRRWRPQLRRPTDYPKPHHGACVPPARACGRLADRAAEISIRSRAELPTDLDCLDMVLLSGTRCGLPRCANSQAAAAPKSPGPILHVSCTPTGSSPSNWTSPGVMLVGDTGFEPVTSSVSGKRATAAPIARGGDGI